MTTQEDRQRQQDWRPLDLEKEERPDVLYIMPLANMYYEKECRYCDPTLPHEAKLVKRRWPKK